MHYQTGKGVLSRTKGAAQQVAEVIRLAEQRLKDCPYQELRDVLCDFHEGVLTLRGRVSSFYLKQMAQTVVARLEGVEECVNRLEVRPARHGSR